MQSNVTRLKLVLLGAAIVIGSSAGAADADLTIHIVQGEQRVSRAPNECVATLLGSCVAACLNDATAGVGGLNHFLLPGSSGQAAGGAAERYGVHAMELLVNALLVQGASRARLQAKLFGGADTLRGLSRVGSLNAAFATRFLEREGIRIASECLGGNRGRKVQFWPASGRARRSFMAASDVVATVSMPKPVATSGVLELF